MRTSIIAAAAFSFMALHATANADALHRYQGATSIQHLSAPQRTQAFAQAEGGATDTRYGRRYAQAEAPTVSTQRNYAQAEAPTVSTQRNYAQAEAPTVSQPRRYAAGEQTGVDNGRLA